MGRGGGERSRSDVLTIKKSHWLRSKVQVFLSCQFLYSSDEPSLEMIGPSDIHVTISFHNLLPNCRLKRENSLDYFI